MTKPRLLDLFCCEGGAATGYARAGFEVVGVDIKSQPRYPFEFHKADALDWLAIAAGILATLVTVATLSLISTPPTVHHPAPVEQPAVAVATPKPAPVTFAVVGDSISQWIDRDGSLVSTTWTNYVRRDDVQFTGQGWAKGGAKLSEMEANVTPINADVLVILAGTNDEGDRWGTPMPERLQELTGIVVKSQAKRVIVSTVPPMDRGPQWATDWNAALTAYARSMGWTLVDPWTSFRTPDGHYTPGSTVEGIHPTPATAQAVSVILADAIRLER